MDFDSVLLAKKLGGGGGGSATLIDKNISSNGTYNASSDNADGYKKVVVSVPNSYSAGDEGKVVSSGALVSQTSATYDSNGTYDTTLKNSVTVDVASGWSADDIANRSISGNIVCSTPTNLYPYCFAYTGITSFSSDSLTNIDNYDSVAKFFYKDTSLTSISIPNATSEVGEGMCLGCTNLTYVNLPNAKFGGRVSVFNGCSSLQEIVLPKATGVANSSFANCSSLQKIDLSSSDITTSGSIATKSFTNCSSLNVLILRKGSVFSLGHIDAFSGTPFASGGTGGTIYVPSSLKSTYQSASNWTTILSYANNNIETIEGSIYE